MKFSYFVIVILIWHVECLIVLYNNENNLNFISVNSSTEYVTQLWTNDVESEEQTLEHKVKIRSISAATRPIEPTIIIPPELVQEWASKIAEKLIEHENRVVGRKEILQSYANVKMEERSGSAIVQQMAEDFEELLLKRARAAEKIGRHAELLANTTDEPPGDYVYDRSIQINELKTKEYPESQWVLPAWCRNQNKVHLKKSSHFDGDISMDISSVHTSPEIFDCEPAVKKHLYWSEKLLSTFKENYVEDATMDFQYFCSAKGFLRHYPAALWSSMFQSFSDADDVYDCRLRPWYVSASGAPRDVLILLDASGSMVNSSNQVTAETLTLTLLSALTDDDQVNVIRFNVIVESPISCFNDRLVPANNVNSEAMMGAIKLYDPVNKTDMKLVLEYAVKMLQKQESSPETPISCQQAIVLVTDSMYSYLNYSEKMQELDPTGKIRLFVLWLHDRYGLRDDTLENAESISCERDGYFAELTSNNDVTEQVMRILRVLERPLVAQRQERLRVFSDVYAHVEDPRRGQDYWKQKENTEQAYRYKELRRNKDNLLSSSRLYNDYMHQMSLDDDGYYYEGEDIDYRLLISVSVPVFDYITLENITIKLMEENQRNATRTYPVNRLLGVAGVDIPIDHLQLILPYHQVGAGGTLFIVDHRGKIVLHDNLKPVFDGDILKPGYRTVDFSDIEQSGANHSPRYYPKEWKDLRKALVIEEPKGNRKILAKYIFEGGMRARVEQREYHWQRVLDHYTAIVVLPVNYNRWKISSDSGFTQKLASDALDTLSRTDFSVHPKWLYCQHVEPHFDSREPEVLHFIRRRSQEPNFTMKKLNYFYSPLPLGLFEKNYQCNEDLMARLCRDAVATAKWIEHQESPDENINCKICGLGSVTAFFATESGLTRWRQHQATSAHANPPDGSVWPGGPTESWYLRAVASPGTLIIHAPVTPVRRLRNSDAVVPHVGQRAEWLTAARSVDVNKGTVGVAGYHFHPHHLKDLIRVITNSTCNDQNNSWACVLIDEGGWIVSGDDYVPQRNEDPVRRHLATVHPAAMVALLNAKVFRLNWIHDYQGVCFPSLESSGTSVMLSTILKTIWYSIFLLFHIPREIGTIVTLIYSGNLVLADTKVEREKRRNILFRDYQREKYERLFDSRVLVNRTRFAACDRSRPMYYFQDTKQSIEMLKRPAAPCEWPLVGAPVPGTNLLLLAIYKLCPHHDDKSVPDPLSNKPVDMVQITKQMGTDMDWEKLNESSRLACWRNIEPLPGRPPSTKCFQHDYKQEAGYRQCGPWLPDREDGSAKITPPFWFLVLITVTYYVNLP